MAVPDRPPRRARHIRRQKIVRFFPRTGESAPSRPPNTSSWTPISPATCSGLERMPERQRAALLLAELHDLTGLELAAALGVSHVAARAPGRGPARASARRWPPNAPPTPSAASPRRRRIADDGDRRPRRTQRRLVQRSRAPARGQRSGSTARSTSTSRPGSTSTSPRARRARPSPPTTPLRASRSAPGDRAPVPPRDLWAGRQRRSNANPVITHHDAAPARHSGRTPSSPVRWSWPSPLDTVLLPVVPQRRGRDHAPPNQCHRRRLGDAAGLVAPTPPRSTLRTSST